MCDVMDRLNREREGGEMEREEDGRGIDGERKMGEGGREEIARER